MKPKGLEAQIMQQLREDRPYDDEHTNWHIRNAIRKVIRTTQDLRKSLPEEIKKSLESGVKKGLRRVK